MRSTTAMRATTRGPTRRAFTLVEMVVAIAIIVVLVAITVSASVALVERAEVRKAEDTLKILDMALREWEVLADRKLTWGAASQGVSGPVFDMYDEVPHVWTLSEVLYAIGNAGEVRSILGRIDPALVFRYDTADPPPAWLAAVDPDDPDGNASQAGQPYARNDLNGRVVTGMTAVLDPWGAPIRAVHPGRVASARLGDALEDADDDGTVFIDENFGSRNYRTEQVYGTARDRRVLFVSAGPDGKFGALEPLADDDPDEQERKHEQAHDNVYSYAVADEAHDES